MTTSSKDAASIVDETVSILKHMPNVGAQALAKVFKGILSPIVVSLARATAGALSETARADLIDILTAAGSGRRGPNNSPTSALLEAVEECQPRDQACDALVSEHDQVFNGESKSSDGRDDMDASESDESESAADNGTAGTAGMIDACSDADCSADEIEGASGNSSGSEDSDGRGSTTDGTTDATTDDFVSEHDHVSNEEDECSDSSDSSDDMDTSESDGSESALDDDTTNMTDACSDAGGTEDMIESTGAAKDLVQHATPADYRLAPGAQPGSLLRLYDGTVYTVKAEDKLLLGTCCNLFAQVPCEFFTFVSQVIIDLVCANFATLNPDERVAVANQLQKDQKAAGADSVPDPLKYSRSMLRRFDPQTPDYTLLFAHVQSGKTTEQMRLAIVAWFVLGVQPIMHVQNASGRLVHAPQFVAAFRAFANLDASPGFSVGLADLVRSYKHPDRRRWLGLQLEGEDDSAYMAKLDAFLSRFLNISAVTTRGCASLQSIQRRRLVLPILLANTSSARNMAIKKEKEKSEEKSEEEEAAAATTFLQRMRDTAQKAGYKDEQVPIMMIFDEDDNQVGGGLYGPKDSNAELSTKYEIISNGKAFRLFDLGEGSSSDGATAVFRKLVRFTVSVTATPAGTLFGKAPYTILRQDKVPWNYFGLANNGFLRGVDPVPERALRIREISSRKQWLNGPSVSMLSESIYREMVLNVAQDMVCKPSAVAPGYRNCLFFGRKIGAIQNALVQTLSIVSDWLSKDESCTRQSAAVFGIEFHSSGYKPGLESVVEGMDRAPLRVYVNKTFFDRHERSIASGVKALAKRRDLDQRMYDLPCDSIRKFAATMCKSEQGSADDGPAFARLHVIELFKGGSAPELRFGFDIVSMIRDMAAEDESFALGFTGATMAMDGRGVVNKDSNHRSALTDQLLPMGRPDMTSLLQSLRVSGCNTEEGRQPPRLWVKPGQEEVLKKAMQVMDELMDAKANPRFREKSLPELVCTFTRFQDMCDKYPTIAAIKPGDAITNKRRAKHMQQQIPEGCPEALLKALLKGLSPDAKALVCATINDYPTIWRQGNAKAALRTVKDRIIEILKEDSDPFQSTARAEVLRRFKLYKRKRPPSDQGQQPPASRRRL